MSGNSCRWNNEEWAGTVNGYFYESGGISEGYGYGTKAYF